VNPDDIAHLRATIQERLDAAERVAVDHSQANRTRYVTAYTLSGSAFGTLGWKYEHAATPAVETQWSSMANWESDRWKQFLADERETAAAALRSLGRAQG
jgi:hypothetical protein